MKVLCFRIAGERFAFGTNTQSHTHWITLITHHQSLPPQSSLKHEALACPKTCLLQFQTINYHYQYPNPGPYKRAFWNGKIGAHHLVVGHVCCTPYLNSTLIQPFHITTCQQKTNSRATWFLNSILDHYPVQEMH